MKKNDCYSLIYLNKNFNKKLFENKIICSVNNSRAKCHRNNINNFNNNNSSIINNSYLFERNSFYNKRTNNNNNLLNKNFNNIKNKTN